MFNPCDLDAFGFSVACIYGYFKILHNVIHSFFPYRLTSKLYCKLLCALMLWSFCRLMRKFFKR